MRSGDWGNLFILANSGLFLASVILQNAGVVDWHSASFVEDGFCVTTCVEIDAAIQDERAVNLIFTQVTAPKTWRSSHAMSFYADAVGAGALAYLAKKYAGEPFAEPVKDAAPGVFMHGLAHLSTWYQGDRPSPPPPEDETKTTKMAVGIVGVQRGGQNYRIDGAREAAARAGLLDGILLLPPQVEDACRARPGPRPLERTRPRIPGATDLRLHVCADVVVVGRRALRVAKNQEGQIL